MKLLYFDKFHWHLFQCYIWQEIQIILDTVLLPNTHVNLNLSSKRYGLS